MVVVDVVLVLVVSARLGFSFSFHKTEEERVEKDEDFEDRCFVRFRWIIGCGSLSEKVFFQDPI